MGMWAFKREFPLYVRLASAALLVLRSALVSDGPPTGCGFVGTAATKALWTLRRGPLRLQHDSITDLHAGHQACVGNVEQGSGET